MTDQEMFDAVWKGAKAQGFVQSTGDGGFCAYRGRNGLKCNFGHVIPDERYDPKFEGLLAAKVIHKLGMQVSTVLAEDLQETHDLSWNPDDHEQQLRGVAWRYDLTIPE